MRTLPTPPACGEHATIRIELYTSQSLDACAYTCATHAAQLTAEIVEAGLSAEPFGMTVDVDRPCGYLHVFPTGNLADPTRPTHAGATAPTASAGANTAPRPAAWTPTDQRRSLSMSPWRKPCIRPPGRW
ncbi:hypothetical protein [Micromonospora vulcania]|uniref:Uncharacterized protein n=1 Tax=Micromonospora vulcania TaxID=1441873 RepID=A0ABW1H9P4_9ACTN